MAAELVEDPVLRQRYRLTLEGDVLRVELWADPGARAPEHYHPRIEERFEVVEGEFTFMVDGEKRKAGPGDRLVAKPGVRHGFENTGEGVARFVAEVDPALGMKEFFEESAALARAGKFMRPGIPKGIRGTLDAAEFAERHLDDTVMSFPPPAVQRIVFPPLARLARRRAKPA
jgi:quercetin dioxygenase-like cupin family protein